MTVRELPKMFQTETTTPERAWWFGVLLGDGNVFQTPHDARVSVCGSLSTVTRWLALLDSPLKPQEFKRSKGTYQGYVNSKIFVEYLRDVWGLCGPKAGDLPWIAFAPEHEVHFLRGLWDTDGSLFIERRRHKGNKGNDTPRAKFDSKCEDFVWQVRDALERNLDVPRVAICEEKKIARKSGATSTWFTIKYGGTAALQIADFLYATTPTHLVNDDRLRAYEELKSCGDSSPSCACGGPVQKQGLCTKCWWAKRPAKTRGSTLCSCGKVPILAKGLCSACYSRARRRAA
jgi:hypothetical protein